MTAERWSVGAEAAGLEALGSHRSGQRARNGMVGYGRSGGLGAAGHQIGLKIRRHHHVIENFVGLSRGHPTFPFLAKVPEIDR